MSQEFTAEYGRGFSYAVAWREEYDVEDPRVDFELVLRGDDAGNLYKKRLSASGRSHLLHWIEHQGRVIAETILGETDWQTGHAKRKSKTNKDEDATL